MFIYSFVVKVACDCGKLCSFILLLSKLLVTGKLCSFILLLSKLLVTGKLCSFILLLSKLFVTVGSCVHKFFCCQSCL